MKGRVESKRVERKRRKGWTMCGREGVEGKQGRDEGAGIMKEGRKRKRGCVRRKGRKGRTSAQE